MNPWRPAPSALIHVVADTLADAGVDAPPVDAVNLARRMGLEVVWNADQIERGRLVRRGRRAMISLRPEPRRERVQWTVAHEIGEYLAASLLERLGVEENSGAGLERRREDVASRFAGLLLAPPQWFDPLTRCRRLDLEDLKARFSTASHEILATRLLDTRPLAVISVFDQNAHARRISNLPCRTPGLTSEETETRREAHASARPVFRRNGGQTVHAWPIHEPGWAREITLLEFDPELVGAWEEHPVFD